MTQERMKELLNEIVEHVAVACNTTEQIQELMEMGFTAEELYTEFGYSESDVRYAEQEAEKDAEYDFC